MVGRDVPAQIEGRNDPANTGPSPSGRAQLEGQAGGGLRRCDPGGGAGWTERLRSTLAAVGLALAGRAGARMASVLGLTVSRSTLLRLVDALPEPEIPAPPGGRCR